MANTVELDKVSDPGIRKSFVDGYEVLKPDPSKLFKVSDQESKTDEYQNYTGISEFNAVGEGESFDEDSPQQAYGVSLTPVKYGKLFPVTYETMKWSKVKKIYDATKILGKAGARTVHKRMAYPFNNGFNTSYTTLSDGKPWFSTQHPRADGGSSLSNASSSSIPFSEANLEVGMLALEDQLDNNGELFDVMTTRVVVPNALRKSAVQVLNSQKKSGSADNDVNVYRMQEYYGSIDLVVYNYIGAAAGGSDTAWFLEDEGNSRLTWQWAQRPKVEKLESEGGKSHQNYWRGFLYASMGWKDWRGWWGSKGDSSSYSS